MFTRFHYSRKINSLPLSKPLKLIMGLNCLGKNMQVFYQAHDIVVLKHPNKKGLLKGRTDTFSKP